MSLGEMKNKWLRHLLIAFHPKALTTCWNWQVSWLTSLLTPSRSYKNSGLRMLTSAS